MGGVIVSSAQLFDPNKIAEIEAEPTILGFFLYSATINADVAVYFTASAADLDVLTGTHFRLFFVESDDERREETCYDMEPEAPDRRTGFYTGMERIAAPRFRKVRKRNVYAVAALGDHFLDSEYFRMPCLVFFPHFESRQFYVYEVDHLSNEETAKLIMRLATETKAVWGDRTVPENDELRKRVRQQTYDQFIPTLKRVAVKERLRSISKDATILTILGSAIGLV